MSSNSATVIAFVKRRKENLIKVFGSKCCLCGFDKWQSALEFHHVNAEDKDFGITTDTTTKALEKQLEELKKCILVCSNCHRGIHGGFLQVPENWQQLYNTEIAQQLINDVHAKKYYCKICGKEKSRNGILCEECSRLASRKSERPSRDELKELIRTETFVQIGLKFNVSDNAIRKWCDSMNLPRKKREIDSYSDEEWENI